MAVCCGTAVNVEVLLARIVELDYRLDHLPRLTFTGAFHTTQAVSTVA
jgi:hypothetical protein